MGVAWKSLEKKGLEKGVEKTEKVGKLTEVKMFLIAGVLAAMGCGQVGAQVGYETVVGNLGTAGTGSELVGGWKLAMAFHTGNFVFRPDGLGATTLKVRVTVSPDAPDAPGFSGAGYSLYLALDGGGQPGTVVRSFVGNGPLMGTETVELSWTRTDFSPHTNYWVILENAGNYDSAVRWDTGSAGTGVGSLGTFVLQPDGASSWNSVPFSQTGYVEVTASVPEPSSAGLVALGLGCWLARRWRGGR